MLASSAVDFDDLLLHVARLLYDNAEIRAELDERYRYVLVDEYQDTNKAQYVILRALSSDYQNLAVTGDPDQSIYGWRGADLNNILEFEHDYPLVKVVRLERNYRSTKRILHVADELIGHNLRRKKKQLWTENGDGAPVRLISYVDQDKEAADIADQIRTAVAEGKRKPSDFAIFYRVNALSRVIEKGLRAANVPYQMVRGQEFYARKEIKDVLAYCQLVNNPRDDMAFERTINTPTRGIGRKTIERLTEHAYRYGMPLLEAARGAWEIESFSKATAAKVAAYVEIIDRITALVHGDVEEVIGTVLEASGYRASLAGSDDEQDQNRLANIEELLTDAPPIRRTEPGRRTSGGVFGAIVAGERDRQLGRYDGESNIDDTSCGKRVGVSGGVYRCARRRRVAARTRGSAPGRTRRGTAFGVRGDHAREGRAATELCGDARLPRRAAADDTEFVPDGNAATGNGSAGQL